MFGKFLNKLQNYIHGASGEQKAARDRAQMHIDTKILLELLRPDGTIIKREYKNIITQRASLLVQKRLANHAGTNGITHFAIGMGDTFGDIPDNLNSGLKWECDNPPKAPSTGGRSYVVGGVNKPGLVNELARKKIDIIQYLDTDDKTVGGGALPVSGVATHIAAYKAIFLEHEGNGPIMEFALFGGNVWPDIDYIPSYQTSENGVLLRNDAGKFITNNDPLTRLQDPGDMVTYKTHKLFYKTSQDRLRMTYIITIELNPDLPEAAGD